MPRIRLRRRSRCDGRRSNLSNALTGKGAQCVCQICGSGEGAAFAVVVAARWFGACEGLSARRRGAERRGEPAAYAGDSVQASPATLVSGSDELGLCVRAAGACGAGAVQWRPLAALHLAEAIEEKPANEVRSVSRYFCSELEDKPWYYDKDFWRGYLDLLAAAGSTASALAFGLEYDFPRGRDGRLFSLSLSVSCGCSGVRGRAR